jgi:hypothetical protein
MKKYRIFASAGSHRNWNNIKQIHGEVKGITFTSKEFTGTMDSQKFWDDLMEFAKLQDAFIELIY